MMEAAGVELWTAIENEQLIDFYALTTIENRRIRGTLV